MSEAPVIGLAGASGLIGRHVIMLCTGREDLRLTAVARRETPLPPGARMELFVADPARWGEVFEAVRPRALICALGTTFAKAGRVDTAFRAVDHDLVVATATAARASGVQRLILVSSVGADPRSGTLYLRVKGEAERAVAALGFARLDILRPSLLRGRREGDPRPAERVALLLAPLVNPLLHGRFRQYRAIPAETVAKAALALALTPARGRFVHDNDGIVRAARRLPIAGV